LKAFPNEYNNIKKDEFQGDFLVLITRTFDSVMSTPFITSWKALDHSYIELEAVTIPVGNPPTAGQKSSFGDFFRSDHAEFWSNKMPAIFITDTGNIS